MIEATNYIADNHHDEAKNLELKFFGNIRNTELLKKIRLPYKYLGPIAPTEINKIYCSGDIVVSSSHFETLPTTLIEGLASGCLAVAFSHGGQADIITHKKTDIWLNILTQQTLLKELSGQRNKVFPEKVSITKWRRNSTARK